MVAKSIIQHLDSGIVPAVDLGKSPCYSARIQESARATSHRSAIRFAAAVGRACLWPPIRMPCDLDGGWFQPCWRP